MSIPHLPWTAQACRSKMFRIILESFMICFILLGDLQTWYSLAGAVFIARWQVHRTSFSAYPTIRLNLKSTRRPDPFLFYSVTGCRNTVVSMKHSKKLFTVIVLCSYSLPAIGTEFRSNCASWNNIKSVLWGVGAAKRNWKYFSTRCSGRWFSVSSSSFLQMPIHWSFTSKKFSTSAKAFETNALVLAQKYFQFIYPVPYCNPFQTCRQKCVFYRIWPLKRAFLSFS